MKTTHFLPLCAIVTAASLALPVAAQAKDDKPAKSVIAKNERLEDYANAVARYKLKIKPKIVGGEEAKIADYPWQVSLGVASIPAPSQAHFCGGSVYSATWIVTAAHCLRGATANGIVVTAGTDKLGVGGERRKVKHFIIKSDYVHATNDNDIALLELDQPLPLSGTIKPIALMTAAEEIAWLKGKRELATSGWGATEEGGSPVRDLRHVNVPYVDNDTCNSKLAYNGRITGNMVCAGATGKDSCQGDSGGPLSALVGTTPKQWGVVSWGRGCARPGLVGVYARVPNYATWVASCVAQPGACK